MTSSFEKFGRALGKGLKGAANVMNEGKAAERKDPVIFRTNLRDAPLAEELKPADGWVGAKVQFLIDKKIADADHVVGRTVLKPGARHDNHRLRNCDAFFIVLKGSGMIYTDHGDTPAAEGDVVYSPRGCWHGFNNTSNEDVELLWGWMGAGSIEDSGYEVHPAIHRS